MAVRKLQRQSKIEFGDVERERERKREKERERERKREKERERERESYKSSRYSLILVQRDISNFKLNVILLIG